MNPAALFIRRPVATTLLTLAIALAGILGYFRLPVAPLPQVDFPVILVQATLPGASPATVASSVAAPLEKHLGQIADLDEMTSQSFTGTTRIVLQFGLDRDIDGAARDVEAALNAAHADLPTQLRLNPIYRKVNPADAPILVIALTSKVRRPGQIFDAAANIIQQRLSQLVGIGEVDVAGAALPAVRVELDPDPLAAYGVEPKTSARRSPRPMPTARRVRSTRAAGATRSIPTIRRRGRPITGRWWSRIAAARRCFSPMSAKCRIRSRICATPRSPTASPRCW